MCSYSLDFGLRMVIVPSRLRWLSDEEESALFDALLNWLKPLVTVARNTGMPGL
jgi:hypothetical protein